jgi:PAS domain S-box-containing protein
MSPTDQALSDLRALAAQLIDPHDDRPAWVWSGEGATLIWANDAGLALLELEALDGCEVIPSAPAKRSLQAVARMQVGQGGRGRIEILRVNAGGHQETLVATCRPVDLEGTVAVLALGNASRARTAPVVEPAGQEPIEQENAGQEPVEREPTPQEPVVDTAPAAPSDFTLDIASPDLEPPAAEDAEPDAAPAFAFKPRSRPHRFSFMVGQSGQVAGLSSGLGDAIGPRTVLRDGEVASEALLARLGDLPAAIFHGVDERRRFSEHEVMWPVSDHALVVPVRLSAFDEDDGTLRVFGTALTGKAVASPQSDGEAEEAGQAPQTMAVVAPVAVTPLAVAPMAEEAASAAGLFTRDPAPEPEPDTPSMAMTAQVPGGLTVAAAASAMVAGISNAMARPSASIGEAEPTGVEALDDALETREAQAAGLWSDAPQRQAPEPAPAAALDDTLETSEAEAAGLWSSKPPAAEEAAVEVSPPEEPVPDVEAEFPAETVRAMQAVAAGIEAGLTGGVAGGVVSAVQERDEDEADAEAPGQSERREPASEAPPQDSQPEPTAPTPPAVEEDDLSRPERLTFQEIARRLGARITRREDQQGDPRSLHEGDDTSGDATPAGDVIHLATGEDAIAIIDDTSDASPVPEDAGGQVVPFTRTEPNAERMVLDRLPLGVIIYSDEAVLYANRAALDLAGLSSLQAIRALDGIETLFADGIDEGNGAMTLTQPDGTRVPVTGRLQSVRWEGQSAALLSLREHTPADSEAQEASQDASLLAAGATGVAEGAIQGANASDGALPLVRARIGELEAIIDLASDGVVTLDGEGEIKDLNQAAQALVGYAADDLIGQPFRLLFPEDSRQTALDYLEDMASQGRLSLFNEGRELECITAQGGLVPVFMTLGRLTDDEPATYCAVLRDLSPFKQAETDLVEARKAAEEASAHKSDFLGAREP